MVLFLFYFSSFFFSFLFLFLLFTLWFIVSAGSRPSSHEATMVALLYVFNYSINITRRRTTRSGGPARFLVGRQDVFCAVKLVAVPHVDKETNGVIQRVSAARRIVCTMSDEGEAEKSDFNIEHIIVEIQSRPSLWNLNDNYCNRELKRT